MFMVCSSQYGPGLQAHCLPIAILDIFERQVSNTRLNEIATVLGSNNMTSYLRALITMSLLFGSVAVSPGGQSMIDDFKSDPQAKWRFFADTVMGGVSSGQVEFETEDGIAFARMTGEVSTANNGGFIQIRHDLASAPPGDIKGIRLKVRGNGKPYFVHLRTSGTILPWQYYQAGFDATSQWREIRLPLAAFKASGRMLRETPRATSLKSVAVVAFGMDYDADVQISEIGFY